MGLHRNNAAEWVMAAFVFPIAWGIRMSVWIAGGVRRVLAERPSIIPSLPYGRGSLRSDAFERTRLTRGYAVEQETNFAPLRCQPRP